MAKKNPTHIIAIGASAGGMESLGVFFKNTPVDEVSYVIVQHLSGHFKSHLAELLAKDSKLEVCEATQNMRVASNKVYVIPSKEYMTIANGRLQLTEKKQGDSPHKTVNTFFKSLAADYKEMAVGIVLSGLGDDGAEGVAAIKEAGGLVIAQEPATALYPGMPTSAIETEMVDVILPPEDMPAMIANYVGNIPWGYSVLQPNNGASLNLKPILEHLKGHYPIDFSDYKPTTLTRRVERRMNFHKLATSEQYVDYIKANPKELELLAKDFLISVTAFFRDKDAFEIIEKEVIPSIIEKNGGQFKAWVAGCATGEEAYSLAILVKEHMDKTNERLNVKIFATDIDKSALAIAGKGCYSKIELRNVSPARLKKFFNESGDKYQVKQEIREMLIFANHDLIKNPPYCQMDLISCRNVLIYMNTVLQKKVHAMLLFGLKVDGYLVLGPSENVESLKPYFKEISKKWTIYKKLEAQRSPQFETFTPHLAQLTSLSPVRQTMSKERAIKGMEVDEISEMLLNELDYVGAIADSELNVTRTFGDLNKYLLPKLLTMNLKDLLPDTLAVAVGTASKKALKTGAKVSMSDIPVGTKEQFILVDLLVRPFALKGSVEGFFLILLREQTEPAVKEKVAGLYDFRFHSKELLADTEDELRQLKVSLADAYEKIDASNENMHSFNEELLSANEEMQSANEEMQSVNEELQTINSERMQKINELTELNDDLDNYFRSNVNGQLFVDHKLLLKKFSPSASAYINLQEGDIGRPISHITTNIRFETLMEDIIKVTASGSVITKEVQSTNGDWFQMMIMPFIKRENNKQDGVIITFNDISALKKAQEELALTNQSLLRINEDLHNFVYTASHDLTGPLSNIEITIDVMRETMDELGPRVKPHMDILKKSVNNFRAVIKELSDIARVEREMLYEPDVIPVDELLDEVRLSVLDRIVDSKTVIKTDFKVKGIRFSRKNMRSILYNMISNAIKFKSPKRPPVIEIKTSSVPNFTVLTFSDNGSGIAQNQLDKIFKIYHRINSRVEGTGIGLYLVKKTIDGYGGKVEVESTVGKGTTFKLYFKS